MEYMKIYQEASHGYKDIFHEFQAGKSTQKVSEALKKQLAVDKQKKRMIDSTWKNLSMAAMLHCVDEHNMQITSVIAQHLVNESDINIEQSYLLNHISDHIWQLPNLLKACSELPESAMMDLKQVYCQSNRYQAALKIIQTKAQKNLFYYHELHRTAAK